MLEKIMSSILRRILAPSRGPGVRPGTIVAVAFVFAATLVLAYLSGVMTGRARWADDGPTGTGDLEPARPGDPVGGEILDPAALRFAGELRTQPGEKVLPPPPPPPEDAPPPMPPGMRPAVPPGEPIPPPARPAVPPTVFDYVFQVAAFKDTESVDDLRQRLEGRGYRTRVARSGRYHVIYLLVRGDARRAEEVPRVLRSLRLGEPLLRSKKPVR